jgi:hypothetical protein
MRHSALSWTPASAGSRQSAWAFILLSPPVTVGYGELFATQVQGFGTSLSNVSHAILLFSRYIFRLVVSKASTAATRMIINFVEARSNTLLSGLETLAVGINRKPQNPGAILRSFGALIDSIPSASLVRFTLLLIYPERSWLEQLDWLPFADALQRLHQELSPGTRKVVRVAIVAYQLELEQGRDKMRHPTSRAAELVPLVQSALQCMKEYADVEVVGGLHRDFREPGGVLTVPHFPMAVYVT